MSSILVSIEVPFQGGRVAEALIAPLIVLGGVRILRGTWDPRTALIHFR